MDRCLSVGVALTCPTAKTHARKVAEQLGNPRGLICLPGQETSTFEDSDMGPEFRQRR